MTVGGQMSKRVLTIITIIDYHVRGQTGKTITNYHEEFDHDLNIMCHLKGA